MTVYVVTSGDYSAYSIDGMFSTKAKAEVFMEKIIGQCPSIEEHELDELENAVLGKIFCVVLWADTGATWHNGGYERMGMREPGYAQADSWVTGEGDGNRVAIRGESTISEEHALKLAAEYRQNWLRENAHAS